LSKFIDVSDGASLVVGGVDGIELGALCGFACAVSHGGVVDVGAPTYFGEDNVAVWVDGDVDNDASFFLDGVEGFRESAGSE